MKGFTQFAMAGLFLISSLALAQQATPTAKHKRVHTRPPYSGPMKKVDLSKLKHPLLPVGKAKPKTGIQQTPAGQTIVR